LTNVARAKYKNASTPEWKSQDMPEKNRVKALDIALKAGVSTSTVDRVLNARGRVSNKTVDLVMKAQSALENDGDATSAFAKTIEVILPANAGNSTWYLASFLKLAGKKRGVQVRVNWVSKMNPGALSAALLETLERSADGIAFQALDHPLVHEAVNRLHFEGVTLTTIVSDLTGNDEIGYVGIDNRAAGRTAGLLMGNYCAGAVAVVWSGQLSRAHEERESGFRALMRTEFPAITVKDVSGGNDEPKENFRIIKKLLENGPEISGIYCVGAGPSAIVDAVSATKKTGQVKVFAHNLTHVTCAHLLASEIDIIIHQDMQEIANCTIDKFLGETHLGRKTVATHVITRENVLYHLDLADANGRLESRENNT
jgi:LacI family transcriptional regulator